MDPVLKQRLVGAAALAALAVIFLPMILDEPEISEDALREPLIPPRPAELRGPQFEPLTEAEIRRDAHLPAAPVRETLPAPHDGAPSGDPPAGAPAARSAAPPAQPAPDPKTRTAPAAQAARPAADPAPIRKAPAGAGAGKASGAKQIWVIQLGSFESETNAATLRERLRKLGFEAYIDRSTGKAGTLFRVRVGPGSERRKAEALRARIAREARVNGLLVRHP